MGNLINRLKFKRDCYKCKMIDIELSDTFNNFDTQLPIIELIKSRNIRKEMIYNKIKNRMINIREIYKKEMKKNNIDNIEINNDYVLYT